MSDSAGNVRRGALQAGQRTAQVVVFVCALAAVGFYLASHSESGPVSVSTPTALSLVQVSTPLPTVRPSSTPLPTFTPAPSMMQSTPTPRMPHIGIVAGHWWLDESGQQSLDVGSVCDEGTPNQLTELDINLPVAERVVYALRQEGYQVDLLQEWDERLTGYEADVLLSIHADACLYPEASGFKVARVTDSQVPEIEDRLVACLVERYGARTGLAFHEGSITADMTAYHTFYEIHPTTPGAIIEVGFMLADRTLLTERHDLVAQGIIDGILCFLAGEADGSE